MKLIEQTFKSAQAVACLANEWRDTLSYSALAGGIGYVTLSGHAQFLPIFIGIAAVREMARDHFWFQKFYDPRYVGDQSSLYHDLKNSLAARVAGTTIGTLALTLLAQEMPVKSLGYLGPAISMANALWAFHKFGQNGCGISDIPKLYFDKETGMWDWPRKNGDGGGTTQTEKVKQAFSKLGTWAGGRLPPPHPVPTKQTFQNKLQLTKLSA